MADRNCSFAIIASLVQREVAEQSEVGGIVISIYIILHMNKQSPSQPFGCQPPLHKGAFLSLYLKTHRIVFFAYYAPPPINR